MTITAVSTATPVVDDVADLTVMFSDLVASTAQLEALGAGAWVVLLDTHTSVVGSAARQHGGQVATFLGDGFMVLFECPDRAIEAARRIQQRSIELGQAGVRIALDHGTMMRYRYDWWVGRPAHVAARLVEHCRSGEVLVSDDCCRAAGRSPRSTTDASHLYRLRGLCEPTTAHAIGANEGLPLVS